MNSEIIKFSECGDSARKELAAKVLLGQACICVLIPIDCFGLSQNDPDYDAVDDVTKHFASRQSHPMLNRFETSRYMGLNDDRPYYTTEEDEVPGLCVKLLDYRALNDWITENNRVVKPGLYELANSIEIAAELVAGNTADLYQSTSLLQNWSEHRGVFIRVGEDTWELFTLRKLFDRIFTFEENGQIYCRARFPKNLQLVFQMKDSQSDGQIETEVKPPKRRVRRDEVTSNIHEYLDSCAREKSHANTDGCWRFLATKLDPHPDGYLIWYTQKAEPKHVTKKQVSSRLARALEACTPK